MLNRDRGRRGTVVRGATIWMCLGLFFFAACALPRSGTRPTECTAAVECDDNEPCTSEICNDEGLCEYTVLEIELPQVKGDCAEAICEEGKTVAIPTPADLPVDDNPCTQDLCGDDGPSNPNQEDGTACVLGGSSGVCADGVCEVACNSSNAAERCDDDNPCTTDSCDLSLGKCVNQALDSVPVPGEGQQAGDCKQLLCESGKQVEIIDNSDVPFDDNECTEDICTEGMPSNPAKNIDVACSTSGDPLAQVCDGNGTCVQCNSPGQCSHLPADDDCQTRTCSAQGVCGQDFTAADTLVNASLQTAGDCQTVVCDGSGNTVSKNEDSDLPDDNNDCTDDQCNNGVPSNNNLSQGSNCGNNNAVCNAQGQCVGCITPADCAGTDTFCAVRTCSNTGVCGVDNTADGTALPMGDQVAGDCLQKQCNGQGSVKEVAVNDPFNDGNQCTTDSCNSGTPVNQNKAVNASCSQNNGSFCDGNGSCVECNQPDQCSGAGLCQADVCNANSCAIENLANNTPAPDKFQTAADCQLVVCDGNAQTTSIAQDSDVPVDNNDCTDDVCTNGVPSNPNKASGTTCQGGVCNGLGVCAECVDDTTCPQNETCDVASFTCKLKQGETCTVAGDCITGHCTDGFCCDTACGGTCEYCALAASEGTCTAVPSGQDTGNDCPAGQACDGAKACKGELGESCMAGGDCLSTYCTDGVCCDAQCNGTCERCNDGMVGTCQSVASGSDPDNECSGQDSCNGMGSCQCSDMTKNGNETDVDCGGNACGACADGQSCSVPGDCQSGVCDAGTCSAPQCGDGVKNGVEVCDAKDPLTPCCNDACNGSKISGEACGDDPDGDDCAAAPTCDGFGTSTSNCQAQTQPDNTVCDDDGLFCTGVGLCSQGTCSNITQLCPGPDGDADCSEMCDEVNNNCEGNDPQGSSCFPANKICDGNGNCT